MRKHTANSTLNITLSAKRPGNLDYVDVSLFKHFSSIEEIDVQIATAGGQTSVELEPGDTRVKLP